MKMKRNNDRLCQAILDLSESLTKRKNDRLSTGFARNDMRRMMIKDQRTNVKWQENKSYSTKLSFILY